jgi:uridylate kinase
MNCQVLLKATSVDGIYSADPKTHPDATRFDEITYMDVLQKGLKVMDSTAITLCMDNKLPIIVFNLKSPGAMAQVVAGENVGTLVHAKAETL